MKTYVIMKRKCTAIVRYEPVPHMIVGALSEAKQITELLNKKAQSNEYWHKKVQNNFDT